VNCIVPGSTPAPGQSAATPAGSQNMNDRAATRSPLGRRVNPQETGDAVLFLLSDLSGGITGHSLPVDVGASTNHPNGSAQDFKRTAELLRAGG
jgi:enoyl-[acyl-carrier-protein] reductase (NADH)